MKSEYERYIKYIEKYIPKAIKKYYETPSLQRLKGVGYFCGMDYASKDIYDFKYYVSTFDHSKTTAGITSKFTDDKRAILAALYHDVSKPTCGHVVDYMNKDYATQESTEEYTKEIILNDDLLMKYLKEEHIEPEEIADFKRYSLVDLNRPSLCADRIDGVLLNSLAWSEKLSVVEAHAIIDDLEVYKNEDGKEEIGFKSKFMAKYFYMKNKDIDNLTHTSWDTYMMELLASIIKLAIEEELITYESLYYLTDSQLFKLFEFSSNKELKSKLTEFEYINKGEIQPIRNPQIKKRLVNPLVNGTRLL